MYKAVYFFDQPCPRRGLGRRRRKDSEDIYDGLKLNSSYLQYNHHGSYQSSDFGSSRSLLPEIKQAVSLLKQQLDGLFGDQEYNQRLLFEEALLTAPELLTRLEMYLNMFTEVKPSLPVSLEHDLMSGWQELIANVKYTVREWQCLSMQDEAEVDKLAPKEEPSASDLPTEQSSKTFSKTQSIAGDLDKQSIIGKDLPSVRHRRKISTCSHRTNLSGIVENKERRESRKGVTLKPKSNQRLSICSSRSESVISSQKVTVHPVLKNPGTISESKLASNQAGYWTQIQFQLSSKACKDKGWIVNSNETEAEITIEKTLRQVTERLRKAIKESKEHGEQSKEPDYSVNLFHFYGDNIRELASKSKWSGSLTAQGLQMLRGLKPRIPPLTMAIGNGKMLFKVSMMDGSSIVYYPSGQVAVTCTRPGQSQNPGYYTVAYDEGPSHRMLACFTPSGKGCCYHDDGSLWFLATEGGIALAEKGSQVFERLDWPVHGTKLTTPLFLQLNPKLTFRCNNRQSMQLSFSWQRQSVKFYVGLTPGAERSPTKEELGCLLSGLDFESKTAHNFSPSQYQRFIKQKTKVKVTARKRTLSTCEGVAEGALLSSSSEFTVSDKESGATRLKLEKRIKVLLDDWLLHYRVSLGIVTPETSTPDDQRVFDVQSTRSSPIGRGMMTEEEEDGSVPLSGLPAIRLLSAPVGDSIWSMRQQRLGGRMSQSVQFQEKPPGKTDIPRELCSINFAPSSTALESFAPRPVSVVRPRSVVIRPVSSETLGAMLSLCPSKVRLAMLGELGADRHCVHRTIPFITDVEYDDFIKKFIPDNQMAVVSVISSVSPELTLNCRSMLERIHERQFRTRLWPCFQSRNDPFRIFLYDVATAAKQLGDAEPLLTRQHNVVPGMFLIYKNGRLQFCDHIFNGYSTAEKDFLKQLDTTNALAERGHFLPSNFRFSAQARASYSQFALGKGLGMDVVLKRKQAIRMISLENGTGLNSRSYQSRAALDQVINIISISNSAAAAGVQIMPKKARSEKSDSLSSSAVVSHST